MAEFYKVHIQEIKQEAADAVSVVFNIPESLKATFNFISGQYITLQQKINDEMVRRAYSICSTPESGELRVAIKKVEKGIFSSYVVSELKVGDTIEIAAPAGRFLLQPEAHKNYIGFAAGSGITPILSMLKTTLNTDTTATFTLVYGNKSVPDTIFFEELNNLKETYSERFKLHYIYSRSEVINSLRGRIDGNVTNYFVKNMYKETSFEAAFLCGPEEMIKNVSKALESNKIPKEKIHFELFTATVDTDKVAQVKEGTTEVTVLLDDEVHTFTMEQTDDILAANLRNNIDAPYSCQGGVCSSCLAKVTEGKAVMVKNSILTDSEIEDGLILTCQAHPITAKLTIDFDDV
ncbi:Phenylacetate-CoA oxygenase/reductase, PaaK subunit [Polaribacter irgensii 23-P]|uniref:Phenylacetate-CoA oxygenase/reductase, PaaK subunit n=1 Tax=Polaribacter irgensii 23-P TaxID=313594 RepID=A4BXX8_9FLAO|nr:ferredoxin--NADP reductase [Polaribacter irgensii]EAR13819.1 Phenylacetate-CoA oxygenase/reductase, PaaK subunit [Polaribacter irgensii 23-P]